MKSTARAILSASTAAGLTAFTIISGFTAAASASLTATGFGLLAAWGIVELAIHSYTPRRLASESLSLRVAGAEPVAENDAAEFPVCSSNACAA